MPSLIEARDLTKRFGEFTAVDGISFTVDQGESFGFLGPNGAGKTSTMRMIGAVSPITSGSLSVLSLDPEHQGPQLRARLGVVPQEDNLDEELTVYDNLMMYGRYFDLPRAVIKDRIEELLDFVHLGEDGDRRGLDGCSVRASLCRHDLDATRFWATPGHRAVRGGHDM